jgi:hypothetical protein
MTEGPDALPRMGTLVQQQSKRTSMGLLQELRLLIQLERWPRRWRWDYGQVGAVECGCGSTSRVRE